MRDRLRPRLLAPNRLVRRCFFWSGGSIQELMMFVVSYDRRLCQPPLGAITFKAPWLGLRSLFSEPCLPMRESPQNTGRYTFATARQRLLRCGHMFKSSSILPALEG